MLRYVCEHPQICVLCTDSMVKIKCLLTKLCSMSTLVLGFECIKPFIEPCNCRGYKQRFRPVPSRKCHCP